MKLESKQLPCLGRENFLLQALSDSFPVLESSVSLVHPIHFKLKNPGLIQNNECKIVSLRGRYTVGTK